MSRLHVMRFYFLTFCIFINTWNSFAQTAKQWEKYGDLSSKEQDYYGASIYYKNALELDSNDIAVLSKYAESLKGYNEYELAEKTYQKLIIKDTQQEFPMSYFWLASMNKYNARYDEAILNFNHFLKFNRSSDPYFSLKARQELISCRAAKELMRDTVEVKILNAGDVINTTGSEFAPLPLSEQLILFSSLRSATIFSEEELKEKKYAVKIYEAEKFKDKFDAISIFDSTISSAGYNTANGTFNEQKNIFYFTGCNENANCLIYESRKENEKWSSPVPLDTNINKPDCQNTQPHLTKIERKEVLLFVSNREGGKGKSDIWYSVKNENSWSAPVNIENINTPDDELTPFYDRKENMLYFSSSWHPGLGGFDIFKSYGNLRVQQSPVNLGYPINTSTNEIYYTHFPDSSKGYLTSNRKGSITEKGETCCNDIWVFERPVKLIAQENTEEKKSENNLGSEKDFNKNIIHFLPVTLYFHNDQPNPRSTDTTTSANYKELFESYLGMENEYKEKYKSTSKTKADEVAIDSFFNYRVKPGMIMLDSISRMIGPELEKGKSIIVTIKGHASPLASSKYNVALSKRRNNSVVNYFKNYQNGLFNKFIDSGTLSFQYIPFGEYKAHHTISDKLTEHHLSIYSPEASGERYVQITGILETDNHFNDKVIIPDPLFDAGNIKQGKSLKIKFTVKNSDNKPYTIGKISNSDSRIQTEASSMVIKANGQVTIEAKIDTSGIKGKKVFTIDVILEDGKVLEYYITADIL